MENLEVPMPDSCPIEEEGSLAWVGERGADALDSLGSLLEESMGAVANVRQK